MEATNQRQQSSSSSNQVAQNRADNPLEISKEDIQRVLQVKCQKHPIQNAKFLYLIPDAENVRICNVCIKEKDIPRKNYQDIREIFEEASERELLSYPVLTDSQLGEKIQNIGDNMDSEAILMDQFQQELTNQIEVKIGGRKEARKLKLMEYDDIYQLSKACWSEIIDIENLKRILLDEKNEEKLTEFVQNHISNAEKNTQRIKAVYEQFRGIKHEFSVEQPNQIRSLVCSLIEEIDFFNGTHPSPLHAIEQSDEYKNALQRKQKELEDCQSQANQAQRTLHEQQQKLLLEEIRTLKAKHQEEITSLRQENQAIKEDNSVLKQQLNRERESSASLREQLYSEKKPPQSVNQQSIEKQFQSVRLENLLPGTNLILANFENSKKLSASKNNQQELEFKNDTQRDLSGFSYLDFILDYSTNYVVHVELQQTKGQNKWFQFGLLPESVKNTTGLLHKYLCYSEYGIGWAHINTVLKGKDMRTDDNSLERRSLEMRINIEREILRVGSLPNYDSVVQLESKYKIEPATPFRFFLNGLNRQTKMVITKLETVSQFDNLM